MPRPCFVHTPDSIRLYTLLLLLISSLATGVRGQGINLKLIQSAYLKEVMDSTGKVDPILHFPNLNKVQFFKNEKLLKIIAKAELEQNMHTLDSALTLYVHQFGISNFKQNVDMLWRLGQVKEMVGDSAGAMQYYDLAIKNQRPYVEKIKVHYDSLVAVKNNEWVDLKFYYKLLEARRKIDPLVPPKGVLLNMGPKVNSPKPDYGPFMHPSDSVLVFTSRRDEEADIEDIYPKKNEDLFYSAVDFQTGNWIPSVKFDSTINSEYNEGSACLSLDGKTLIFTRCDAPEGLGSCDIYSAEFYGGKWVNLKNLGGNINSPHWDSQPNLSPDGTMLFFCSNRPEGFGRSDVYVSYKQADGTWSNAINLGPNINTMDDEVTPFFHKVNRTLYFSSTGHLKNFGGYDIFKSRLMPDGWEEPRNVGPLVNTAGNEYYFSIDGKGSKLFYAKSMENDKAPEVYQNFDLYSFPMPMEARPDAIYQLRGYLVDSISGYPLTGVVLVIDKSSGIEIAPKYINDYGYFEFDLINEHKYDVYIQGNNFFTIKESLVMGNDTGFLAMTESFASGKPIVFESLEFEENKYEMTERIEPKLNYLVAFLRKYPMFSVRIKGHTDSEGDAKYNLELSEKRAYMIARYITTVGMINPDRVAYMGYGESRPLVPNNSRDNRKLNRRVEFELILDPNYEGEIPLPSYDEIDIDDEILLDPEFNEPDFNDDGEEDEFNWEDDSGFEFELDEEDEDLIQEINDEYVAPDDTELNPDNPDD